MIIGGNDRKAHDSKADSDGVEKVSSVPLYSSHIDFKSIGQKLKAERKRIGWTQEEVAEAIEISPAYVGHLERAERSMSLDTLIHLCNFYHITIDYLLSDTLSPQGDNIETQIAALLKGKNPQQKTAILDIVKTAIRHI